MLKHHHPIAPGARTGRRLLAAAGLASLLAACAVPSPAPVVAAAPAQVHLAMKLQLNGKDGGRPAMQGEFGQPMLMIVGGGPQGREPGSWGIELTATALDDRRVRIAAKVDQGVDPVPVAQPVLVAAFGEAARIELTAPGSDRRLALDVVATRRAPLAK